MATLAKLVADEALFKVEGDLEPGISPVRFMYGVTGRFDRFLDAIPQMESTWKQEQTPAEQMDDLLNEYLGTEPFTVAWRFGPLFPPAGKKWPGVWELKTPDLRIFGWFAALNTFIGVNGCLASLVKADGGYYGGFRDEVTYVRNGLPLDEPKYVAGEDHNDVISLLYRP